MKELTKEQEEEFNRAGLQGAENGRKAGKLLPSDISKCNICGGVPKLKADANTFKVSGVTLSWIE